MPGHQPTLNPHDADVVSESHLHFFLRCAGIFIAFAGMFLLIRSAYAWMFLKLYR
ncbi:MAG: hypothetical protein ACF8TS_20810 [Maioricimonas sp. JB049]